MPLTFDILTRVAILVRTRYTNWISIIRAIVNVARSYLLKDISVSVSRFYLAKLVCVHASHLSINYRFEVWFYLTRRENRRIHIKGKYPCGRIINPPLLERHREMSTLNFVIFVRPFERNEQLLHAKSYEKSGTNSMYIEICTVRT